MRIKRLVVGAGLALAMQAIAQKADSLPAFRNDSLSKAPFQSVEAGPSPWGANKPVSPKDSAAQASPDSVAAKLRARRPSVSVYLGVGFLDFNRKDDFNAELNARIAKDSLKTLQPYEPVHMAFPIGLQAVLPIQDYIDVVAKTHSYWYTQTAILGDAQNNQAGTMYYAVQANLGGVGLRFYIPPSLLSVSDELGLYLQGLLYWNLGNSEIYTPYGYAPARFKAGGSAYEFQSGFLKKVSKAWDISGALGFMHQDFESRKQWNEITTFAVPAGNVTWGSSSLQGSLNLWYHFGFVPPVPATPGATPNAPASMGGVGTQAPAPAAQNAVGPQSPVAPGVPAIAPSAPADSSTVPGKIPTKP